MPAGAGSQPEPAPSTDPTHILVKDPTTTCTEREPVPAPPGYRPRSCERVLGAEQSAHSEPYLLWDFDFRYHEYAPCPGYRYAPQSVSLVDTTGRVLWCVAAGQPERDLRLQSSDVDNHRLAPWLRPILPWRTMGKQILIFRQASVSRLDVETGALVEVHPLPDWGAALPPYDQAVVTFRVGGTVCRTPPGGPTILVEDCDGWVFAFLPRGVAVAFDPRGKLADTVQFSRKDVKPKPGQPAYSASHTGRRLHVSVETVIFLQ